MRRALRVGDGPDGYVACVTRMKTAHPQPARRTLQGNLLADPPTTHRNTIEWTKAGPRVASCVHALAAVVVFLSVR